MMVKTKETTAEPVEETPPTHDRTQQTESAPLEALNEGESVDMLALRLLALSEYKKRVEAARGAVKRQLEELLSTGDTKKPSLPGQERRTVGTVTYSKGKQKAAVTDVKAFTAWSMKHYPESVDLVPVVKAWHVKAILDYSTEIGEPCHPDGTLDVEGVEVGDGAPYISATPSAKLTDNEWRDLMQMAVTAPQLEERA